MFQIKQATPALSMVFLFLSVLSADGVTTGEIYSLDNLADERILSLEVRDGSVITSLQNNNVPEQRFVARNNSDNTFNLFLEHQSWNWANYIVENSLNVHIKEIPKILDVRVVDGSKQLFQSDYKGPSANAQKWYIVPSRVDPDSGLITNLLHRQCIVNNGSGNAATLEFCNQNDSRQVFQLARRTQGRCY